MVCEGLRSQGCTDGEWKKSARPLVLSFLSCGMCKLAKLGAGPGPNDRFQRSRRLPRKFVLSSHLIWSLSQFFCMESTAVLSLRFGWHCFQLRNGLGLCSYPVSV